MNVSQITPIFQHNLAIYSQVKGNHYITLDS